MGQDKYRKLPVLRGYLSALTRELNQPNQGILDAYLKPFVRPAVGTHQLVSLLAKTRGLDGGMGSEADANRILGKVTDPVLQARYKEQKLQRRTVLETTDGPEVNATHSGHEIMQRRHNKPTHGFDRSPRSPRR